jgi:hypothetical protein
MELSIKNITAINEPFLLLMVVKFILRLIVTPDYLVIKTYLQHFSDLAHDPIKVKLFFA